MKHVKVGLTFTLILAVLIVAFFGSVYLANRTKQKQTTENIVKSIKFTK